MEVTPKEHAIKIIEHLIKRRLKEKGKEADKAWIAAKAKEIYDTNKGDPITRFKSGKYEL